MQILTILISHNGVNVAVIYHNASAYHPFMSTFEITCYKIKCFALFHLLNINKLKATGYFFNQQRLFPT